MSVSVQYLSFFCEAFSSTILDSSSVSLFFSGQVFHELKDPNVLETFQAMIGGKFAPLTITNNEYTDMDSRLSLIHI